MRGFLPRASCLPESFRRALLQLTPGRIRQYQMHSTHETQYYAHSSSDPSASLLLRTGPGRRCTVSVNDEPTDNLNPSFLWTSVPTERSKRRPDVLSLSPGDRFTARLTHLESTLIEMLASVDS